MKVILLKELRGRGGEGDVIDVARGYANNYLLRQGYAILATEGNLKQLEERRANIEKREEVRVADAEALAQKLEGANVVVIAQVGEEGQLFGSVTAPMIADAIIDELGIEIDKRRVELGKPIKQVGTYPVDVNIYRTIKATVNITVKGEGVDDEVAAAEAAADAAGEAVADAIETEIENAAVEAEAAAIAAEVEEVAEEIEESGE